MSTRGVRDPQGRSRLVTAARSEVGARGLDGATVRVIAEAAGVSTGYVMHYFPDKAQLHRAVFAQNNAAALGRIEQARSERRGTDAIAAIVRALLPLDDTRRLEWRVWIAFWVAAGTDDSSAAELSAPSNVLAGILAAALAEAVDDGDLPADLEVDLEAARLVTLAAGLGLLAGVESSTELRDTSGRMLEAHLGDLTRRSGDVTP